MTRYRKKAVEVEAIEYRGFDENGEECELFLGESFESHIPSQNKILIMTLEGEITASKGDFIIRGIQGEFYPRKPDIFWKTYEEVI